MIPPIIIVNGAEYAKQSERKLLGCRSALLIREKVRTVKTTAAMDVRLNKTLATKRTI